MIKNQLFYFFILLMLSALKISSIEAEIPYKVEFEGIEDSGLLNELKGVSQLLKRPDQTTDSLNALKQRAEADIANFLKVLHSQAYYNSRINKHIEGSNPAIVTYIIETGPIYPLAEFRIVEEIKNNISHLSILEAITLDELGLCIGSAAYAQDILKAEDILLDILAENGFPSASISDREIIADQQEKALHVILHVETGPLTYFGNTTVSGHTSIEDAFFKKKIAWKEGDVFNLKDIARTQEALENSGLFTSTTISYQNELSDETIFQMDIQVTEAKHRSISGGISYMSHDGFGGTAEWEHRNARSLGERINIRANAWKEVQEARISYLIPDFGKQGHDLIWSADAEHDKTKGYTDTSLSASVTLERQVSEQLRVSYGFMGKSISTKQSDNNSDFNLVKTPLQLHWTTSNSILDPTTGYTLHARVVPTLQLIEPGFAYCPMSLTGTFYYPLTANHRYVFAARTIVGSIFGTPRHEIPPSERFYTGGENTLRGYLYQTVSPLNKEHKPIGGKSILVLSTEMRIRLNEQFGWIGFYEIGNVYKSSIPQPGSKQLQSVGMGLRYYTLIGPIRLDFAVPLNRRRKVDSPFQAYMSIGQSF